MWNLTLNILERNARNIKIINTIYNVDINIVAQKAKYIYEVSICGTNKTNDA